MNSLSIDQMQTQNQTKVKGKNYRTITDSTDEADLKVSTCHFKCNYNALTRTPQRPSEV